MFTIRINYKDGSHRYLNWCDARWYGTDVLSQSYFTKEEVVKICGQLKKHYVYDYDVLDENGRIVLATKPKSTFNDKKMKKSVK